MDFVGDFGLRDISIENCTEITTDRPRQAAYKFSALNLDFNGPSLDLVDSRKLVHEAVKER